MNFDFVTWSIWAVGFAIWVTWTYFSVEELRRIIHASGDDAEHEGAASGPDQGKST